MKKTILSILGVVVFLSLVTISCNKEEAQQAVDENYVFKNPEWVLVDKNYSEDGKTGELFMNKNNSTEQMFKVNSSDKAQGGKWTGTFTHKNTLTGAEWICQPPVKDCRIDIQKNQNGEVVAAKIVVKE